MIIFSDMSLKMDRSPSARAYLRFVGPYAEGYEPGEATLERLQDVDLSILVGPAGAGKGVHLEKLLAHANALGLEGLKRVLSRTTRPIRPSELTGAKQYEEYANINDWVTRSRIATKLKQRGPVQVIRHPTGELYWTEESAFTHRPHKNVWEATALESRRLARAAIFPHMDTVMSIVPVTGKDWFDNWRGRDGENPPGFVDRLKEAHQSFGLALNDPVLKEKTVFVVNNYGPIDGVSLEYNPNAVFDVEDPSDIPPAFVAMAAILDGRYTDDHAEAAHGIAENLYAFTGGKLRELGFDPDEVAYAA